MDWVIVEPTTVVGQKIQQDNLSFEIWNHGYCLFHCFYLKKYKAIGFKVCERPLLLKCKIYITHVRLMKEKIAQCNKFDTF